MAKSIPAEAIGHLHCPICGGSLQTTNDSLRCARGHNHDIARQGYVSLFPPGRSAPSGDSAQMIAAREDFLAAGHYAPLSDAITYAAKEAVWPNFGEGSCVVDLGAGTAYYLARLLERLPDCKGLALDASRPALRRAARAHERIGAVGCDAWSPLPVRSNTAELALDVFAPRNAGEVSRILAPGGVFVVATPKPLHLEPLVSELGMVGVQQDKRQRLADSLSSFFAAEGGREVELDLVLSRADARALVMMGPSARHIGHAKLEERLHELSEPLKIRASVRVEIFRKRRDSSANGERTTRSSWRAR